MLRVIRKYYSHKIEIKYRSAYVKITFFTFQYRTD